MGYTHIVFWKYQTNKRGESPIFIRVIEDRIPRYIKTGLHSTAGDWDTKNNQFRTNYRRAEDFPKKTLHEKYNTTLKKLLADAEATIQELIQSDEFHSSSKAIEAIRNDRKTGKESIFKYIDIIAERFKNKGKISTSNTYRDLKRALNKYLEELPGETQLKFKDINPKFLSEFEHFLRSRKNKDTTISVYMRTLRSVFNKAIEDKLIKKHLYPFDSYKISKLNTQTVKRAINKSDITNIVELKIEEDSREFLSRNIFLFSYYCRGMNFKDIALLKWDNIENGRISYVRKKTNKSFNILLLEPAIDILNYYRSKMFRGYGNYIFPLLDSTVHKTDVSIDNRLHKTLTQTNKDLKEIGKEAKLEIKLTTYVARHTFAMVLKKEGIATDIISDALGHDDIETTQVYLDSFANDILDEASKVLL